MNAARIALTGTILLLVACASGPDRKSTDDIPYPDPQSPEWVGAVQLEGGMAATECVDDNAPRSITLGRKASALARAKLAEEFQSLGGQSHQGAERPRLERRGVAWSENTQTAVHQLASESLSNSRVAHEATMSRRLASSSSARWS